MTELEKQAAAGRQALNVRLRQMTLMAKDFNGVPVPGTEETVCAIYNKEKLSDDDFINLVKNGHYLHDVRIIITDPERVSRVFPHSGEYDKRSDTNYWIRMEHTRQSVRCSVCGFTVPFHEAFGFSPKTNDRSELIYQFCPKCGAIMSQEKKGDEL